MLNESKAIRQHCGLKRWNEDGLPQRHIAGGSDTDASLVKSGLHWVPHLTGVIVHGGIGFPSSLDLAFLLHLGLQLIDLEDFALNPN